MRRRRFLSGLVAVPAVVVVGCASDEEEGGSGEAEAPEGMPEVPESEFVDETGSDRVLIEARDNLFEPQYVTITAGTEVTWENVGRNAHNALPVEDDAFEPVTTDMLQPGDTASVTFDEPGLYPYYCSLHGTTTRGMVGRIRVVEDSGSD